MSIIKEFKDFAMKGNVMDMAVGVIIGGAFGKIVTSLIGDVIMPPIGLLVGGVNFKDLKLVLKQAPGADPVTMNYGAFIQTAFDFTIIAAAIFVMVKAINSLKKKEEAAPAAPPAPSNQEVLLGEIRDLLREKTTTY